MKGQSGSLNKNSFRCLHFFSSLWFFFLCLVLFSSAWEEEDAKKKVWNRRVEAGAKTKRADGEFESKLPPFSCFFLLFSCVFCLLCVWEEEGDGKKGQVVLYPMCHLLLVWWCCKEKEDNDNVPSFFYVVLLEQRMRWQQASIPFFFVYKKKKKTMMWQCVVVFFYGGVLAKKAMVTCCHRLLLWWC